jgi:hypothetical protein
MFSSVYKTKYVDLIRYKILYFAIVQKILASGHRLQAILDATGSEVNTHEIRACQCQSSTSLLERDPTKSVRSILRRHIIATPITVMCSAKQPGKSLAVASTECKVMEMGLI